MSITQTQASKGREVQALKGEQSLIQSGRDAGAHTHLSAVETGLFAGGEVLHVPEVAQEVFTAGCWTAAAGHHHGDPAQNQSTPEGAVCGFVSSGEAGSCVDRASDGDEVLLGTVLPLTASMLEH